MFLNIKDFGGIMTPKANFDEMLEKAYKEVACLKCMNLKCQVCNEQQLIEKGHFLKMGSGITPILKIKKSRRLKNFFETHKKIFLIWCSRDLLARAFYIYPALSFDLTVFKAITKALKKSCEMYDKKY